MIVVIPVIPSNALYSKKIRYLHFFFVLGVKCRRCFIEKENLRVTDDGTSNSNTLSLTS